MISQRIGAKNERRELECDELELLAALDKTDCILTDDGQFI